MRINTQYSLLWRLFLLEGYGYFVILKSRSYFLLLDFYVHKNTCCQVVFRSASVSIYYWAYSNVFVITFIGILSHGFLGAISLGYKVLNFRTSVWFFSKHKEAYNLFCNLFAIIDYFQLSLFKMLIWNWKVLFKFGGICL